MKSLSKFVIFALSLTLPIVAAAEIYKLVIVKKDGQRVEVATHQIQSMEIVEQAPTALSTPDVKVTTNSAGELMAQWAAVQGADHYVYTLDGGSEISITATTLSFKQLMPGSHSLTVVAVPNGSDPSLVRSAACKVTLQVAFKMTIAQGSLTADQVVFTFAPSHDNIAYLAAVIPASIATDAERMAKVRELFATNSSLRHTGRATATFTGLTSGENYQVVAFAETNPQAVYTQRFSPIYNTYRPGDVGFIFPPGVNLDGGFVDVDKVGKLDKYGYTGTDEELCWACSTAGMMQWWLDDYKRATGTDYPMRLPLPEKSNCYSTPIMDVLAQAFYHDAGSPVYALEWFFKGMPNSITSYSVNSHPVFNYSYTYVNGNFVGMTQEEYSKYLGPKTQSSYSMYRDLTESEVKVKASADIIAWLKTGPLYIDINRGNHALTCWGVKYTVDINGNPIITRLYYAENDLMPGNLKGKLNESGVTWVTGDGPHMTSTNGLNVEITNFIWMKGYSTFK